MSISGTINILLFFLHLAGLVGSAGVVFYFVSIWVSGRQREAALFPYTEIELAIKILGCSLGVVWLTTIPALIIATPVPANYFSEVGVCLLSILTMVCWCAAWLILQVQDRVTLENNDTIIHIGFRTVTAACMAALLVLVLLLLPVSTYRESISTLYAGDIIGEILVIFFLLFLLLFAISTTVKNRWLNRPVTGSREAKQRCTAIFYPLCAARLKANPMDTINFISVRGVVFAIIAVPLSLVGLSVTFQRLDQKGLINAAKIEAEQKSMAALSEIAADNLISQNKAALAKQEELAEKQRLEIEERIAKERAILVAEQERQAELLRIESEARLKQELASLIEKQERIVEQQQQESARILEQEKAALIAEQERLASIRLAEEKSKLIAEQEQIAESRLAKLESELARQKAELVAEQERFAEQKRIEAEKQLVAKKAQLVADQQRLAKQSNAEAVAKLESDRVATLARQDRLAEQERQEFEKRHAEEKAQLLAAQLKTVAQYQATQQVSTAAVGTPLSELWSKSDPLFRAVQRGNLTQLQRYLISGGDPNITNAVGESLLGTTALHGQYILVSQLITAGANIELKDSAGKTALIHASSAGHVNIAELLINSRANPNAQDSNGQSALFYAISNGHGAIAKLLGKNGANTSMKDRRGKSLSALAREQGMDIN